MMSCVLQELFVADLAKQTWEAGDDKKQIVYNTLAKIVNEDETLQFLEGLLSVHSLMARD